MSDSNDVTRPAPGDPPLPRDTTGWVQPAVALPPLDPEQLTIVFGDAPTPGPNAADLATLHEPTEDNSAPRPRVAHLPPIPGYVVERYVSSGGMGCVYRARHLATGRIVALKLTHAGAHDDITRERFVREVRTLATIKHPNIVPIYDAGEWYGFHYCTMEFVEGGTLNESLARLRADLPAAVRLIVKLARAIDTLHGAGILHRDIKPLNILMGPNDEPLLADFGLAKRVSDADNLTFTGFPVGTRAYMAPEQTLGRKENYTPACDVWALGVTFYELLTGHRPFCDSGVTDVYHNIRTVEPTPIRAYSADVPEALQTAVSNALAKAPADRYPSAAALADDLEGWLRGEPIAHRVAPVPAPELPEPPADVPVPVVVSPEPAQRRSVHKSRRLAIAATGVIAATVLAARLVFLPGKPPPEPTPPPPKSTAQRIADGETVKFTDDKGRPLVAPINEPEYAVQWDTWAGYQCFSRAGSGIASVYDDALPESYRVECQVAVPYDSTRTSSGGIYVGRRLWGGLAFKHESMVTATVASRYDTEAKKRTLLASLGLYWWFRHENGTTSRTADDDERDWDRNGKKEDVRFVHVRMDVRREAATLTVDGVELAPLTAQQMTTNLTINVQHHQLFGKGFPDYTFDKPVFGSGIGLFCTHTTCVVRNLTVSKLNP